MAGLQLVAWKVSGDSTLTWEYRRDLPSSYWQGGARVTTQLTSQPGQGGIAGVLNGKSIPFVVEFNHSLIF